MNLDERQEKINSSLLEDGRKNEMDRMAKEQRVNRIRKVGIQCGKEWNAREHGPTLSHRTNAAQHSRIDVIPQACCSTHLNTLLREELVAVVIAQIPRGTLMDGQSGGLCSSSQHGANGRMDKGFPPLQRQHMREAFGNSLIYSYMQDACNSSHAHGITFSFYVNVEVSYAS